MLKKYINYGLGVIVSIIVIFSLIHINGVKENSVLGSIQDGMAYTSTSTDSTYANSIRMFKTSGGTLGSVIVGGTSATIVELRDATSTTDSASTTIATFAASPATGTYTFDSAFTRGLSVVFTGSFTGKYMITWR